MKVGVNKVLQSLCIILWLLDTVASVKIVVNTSETVGELRHFWKSTGFCPPMPHEDAWKFDLGDDMVRNLALIGSIPRSGIEQVRIHWLLDLITVDSLKPFEPPVYNFTRLDSLIDLLYDNGLKPGFELMGNPGGIYLDFEDKTTVIYWKDLVTQTAQRYSDQYGLGYVSGWNFETWNEPDCHDFDKVNITVQGFLNYYDACSEGLLAVSPDLKLGGPGDGCKRSTYSDALLAHVVNGTNYFTGERGVRIDFLSYHKKGDGSSEKILDDEIDLMTDISRKYPSLANKPFFNDEADPLVGWSKNRTWRADSTYAAMVAKIVVQHQNAFISNKSPAIKNYQLLSNDNAFLSWYPHQFTQRTLLARFQINTTSPHHTHFFIKPVYAVMGLLSFLGETQIEAHITDIGDLSDSEIGVLSSVHSPEFNNTSDSWQMSTLVYYSNDTGPQNGSTYFYLYTDINTPDSASDELQMVCWWLDNTFGNPYSFWERANSPDYPSHDLMRQMRDIQGANLQFSESVKAGYQYIGKFFIQQPAVLLIHVCSKPAFPPDQPNNVNVYNITSGQILITWSDKCLNSRCILGYDVVFSKTGDNYTSIVTDRHGMVTSSNSYTYIPEPTPGENPDALVTGYYKVQAINYFTMRSEFSLPYQYPS